MLNLIEKHKKWLRPGYLWTLSVLPPWVRVTFGYLANHGRWPDIHNPKTLNEKIIWRKLYDHDRRFPALVDKITVKDVIARRFGPALVIPTLGVFDTADAIDFKSLPFPCVIKANHASKKTVILKSEAELGNAAALRKKLAGFLAYNHGALRGEWAYTQVKPRLLVEPYLKGDAGGLTDYRFHVFSGQVYMIEVTIDSTGKMRSNFFDKEWNRVTDIAWGCENLVATLPRPSRLKEMMTIAEKLGATFSYVRVDLYEIDSEVKFSELTFYPGAGHDRFLPARWDMEFGRQWKLTT